MNNVEINKQAKLSQHFTLGELCKTSVKTADGNIPSHVQIENMKRVCGWLEMLRDEWNKRYGDGDDPIIINSGYRSAQVSMTGISATIRKPPAVSIDYGRHTNHTTNSTSKKTTYLS